MIAKYEFRTVTALNKNLTIELNKLADVYADVDLQKYLRVGNQDQVICKCTRTPKQMEAAKQAEIKAVADAKKAADLAEEQKLKKAEAELKIAEANHKKLEERKAKMEADRKTKLTKEAKAKANK